MVVIVAVSAMRVPGSSPCATRPVGQRALKLLSPAALSWSLGLPHPAEGDVLTVWEYHREWQGSSGNAFMRKPERL